MMSDYFKDVDDAMSEFRHASRRIRYVAEAMMVMGLPVADDIIDCANQIDGAALKIHNAVCAKVSVEAKEANDGVGRIFKALLDVGPDDAMLKQREKNDG